MVTLLMNMMIFMTNTVIVMVKCGDFHGGYDADWVGVICLDDEDDFHDILIELNCSSSCPTHTPVYYVLSVNRYDE